MAMTMEEAWRASIDCQEDWPEHCEGATEDTIAQFMAQLTDKTPEECKQWILMNTHTLPRNPTVEDIDNLIKKIEERKVN